MLDSLYENIGKKLKSWAKWTFIVEAIAAVIAGLVLVADTDGLSLLYAIVGVLVAWVSSWLLFGFGELIDKTCENERNTSTLVQLLTQIDKGVAPIPEKQFSEAPQKTATSTTKNSVQTSFAECPNRSNMPVSAEIINGEKVCPKCGLSQMANRTVCWSCGQPFDN